MPRPFTPPPLPPTRTSPSALPHIHPSTPAVGRAPTTGWTSPHPTPSPHGRAHTRGGLRPPARPGRLRGPARAPPRAPRPPPAGGRPEGSAPARLGLPNARPDLAGRRAG